MRALSIRQPYAEQILRGEKKIEYRSRSTKIIGEEFYIYASKGRGAWGQRQDEYLRGQLVGTARISHVTPSTSSGRGGYEWHLKDVRRLDRPRKPRGHPQPVWFKPF